MSDLEGAMAADYILPHVNSLLAEAWREGYVAGQVDMDRWTRNEYGYTKNPYEEGLQ